METVQKNRLLFLENYDDAEKVLKSFIKKDNTTNKWKAQISLAFIYIKNKKTYILYLSILSPNKIYV